MFPKYFDIFAVCDRASKNHYESLNEKNSKDLIYKYIYYGFARI